MLEKIRSLYKDDTPKAHRFRYAILIFDLSTIAFVVVTSFFEHTLAVEIADAVFGLVILIDFLCRAAITSDRVRFFLRLATWADVIVIISFIAPIAGEGAGFLRILRTLRLLLSYQVLYRLRTDFKFFREREDIILAGINLAVFLFIMTGVIYATQYPENPQITNYIDALYFTVTTLTTTGFGDITLTGSLGRLLAVMVMIFGVTLFLRLLQVLFRPTKVRHECEACGLILHDADAVHCKHCGKIIHIRTEGGA